MQRRSLLTRAGLAATSIAAVLVASLAMSTPAQAQDGDPVQPLSAYGVATWNQQSIPGVPVPIPAGILEHQINGSGLNVDSEWAEFETAWSNVCNWRIDFRYRNTSGSTYRLLSGSTHTGCDNVGLREVFPGRSQAGSACAQLYVNGSFVVEQCHSIFP